MPNLQDYLMNNRTHARSNVKGAIKYRKTKVEEKA